MTGIQLKSNCTWSKLDWIVKRLCVKTNKDSGIVNDANDWAIETTKTRATRWSCSPAW